MDEPVQTSVDQTQNSPRPRRRWLRFSLRTLLIFVTLICILLPWIIRSERQRRAANQLKAAGGAWTFAGENIHDVLHDEYGDSIYPHMYDPNNSQGPKKYVRKWYQHYFQNIEAARLPVYQFRKIDEFTIDWAGFVHLKHFDTGDIIPSDFWMLETPNPGINKLLRQMSSNTELTSLELFTMDVSDEGMAQIGSFINLEILKMSASSISDVGMLQLANLTKLKKLQINPTKITAKGLAVLAELPKLEELSLDILDLQAVPGLGSLNKVTALKELRLPDRMTDELTIYIGPLTKLEKLLVFDSQISDQGLANFKTLTQLTGLSVGSPNIRGTGLKELAGLEKLDSLGLSGCENLDASCIDHILQFKNLHTLYLEQMKISANDAKRLLELPKLWRVYFNNKFVSKTEIEELNKIREVFVVF